MQVHEITTKINEGFMDAVKGIGSVAAQGINQKLGTNLGGAAAGARVGVGQRQVAAMQINQGLAAKQAQQYSNQYIQSINSLMSQANVKSPSQLSTNTQGIARKEIDRMIFKQLLSNTYVQDLNQLNTKVDKSSKQQMTGLIAKMNNARRGLYDLTTAQNPQESLHFWTELTSAAAAAMNLIAFSMQSQTTTRGVAPQTTGGPEVDITPNGDILYRGQPYDPRDPAARAAVSKFLLAQKNLVANRP